MAYGTVKADSITFTSNSADVTTTLSGIYASTTNNLTLTGTASAVTFTGTTANFVSGVFSTQVSGATVIAPTGRFTSLTGTTTTGTTANFVSGVFSTQVSGVTITGTTVATTTGTFTSLTGTTATFTSGIIASGTAALPSLAILSDPNTGIFSPGADQLAVATNGTRRLLIDSAGALTLDTGDATIYGVRVGRGPGADTSNTVVGNGALQANTTGNDNTANGYRALYSNTTGNDNTAIGLQALNANTSGINNTAAGVQALYYNTIGNNNTANGYRTLFNNTTGVENIAIGFQTLYSNTTGSNNIGIGNYAGGDLTTGSNNTIIGAIAGTNGLANTVIIGAGATERLRIDSSGRLGIGTSAPSELLDIDGDGDSYLRWERDGAAGSYITSGGVLRIGPYFSATDTELALFTDNSNASWVTTGTAQALCLGTNKTARITIGSTGNVGIGTTTLDALLTVNGIGAFGAGAVGTPSISATGDLNTGFWFPAADTIAASTGGTERARIDSSGRLLVGTSTATANGGVLELSGGITFPATAVAASNANTLDDYEEGTWTPTQGAGLTVVGTFSSGGSYIKVGRKILIIGYVSGSTSVAASSFGILCEGLPFNPVNSIATAIGTGANATLSALIGVLANGGTDDIYAVTAMPATTYIYFSVSYIVA